MHEGDVVAEHVALLGVGERHFHLVHLRLDLVESPEELCPLVGRRLGKQAPLARGCRALSGVVRGWEPVRSTRFNLTPPPDWPHNLSCYD
ncbi:MAG TPA: hypothetical protein VK187_06665 [Geobacteraceae bacterium]|nr:hypothetical protein [Geobacteraceae bacterium]